MHSLLQYIGEFVLLMASSSVSKPGDVLCATSCVGVPLTAAKKVCLFTTPGRSGLQGGDVSPLLPLSLLRPCDGVATRGGKGEGEDFPLATELGLVDVIPMD